MVDIIQQFWPQLTAFVVLIMALTRMRVDIDVLKEKVRVLFTLWNEKDNK